MIYFVAYFFRIVCMYVRIYVCIPGVRARAREKRDGNRIFAGYGTTIRIDSATRRIYSVVLIISGLYIRGRDRIHDHFDTPKIGNGRPLRDFADNSEN